MPSSKMKYNINNVRNEFFRLLTQDSPHSDRRKKDYNQAIFSVDGWAVFTSTNLEMVMNKFDKAVDNLERVK